MTALDSFVSQEGEKTPVSTAAYLLFYRRRSLEPLGPPYLRELVQNARNPPEAEASTAAAATDDELAGEDSLGGHRPSSHLLGSSSNGTRAGAGAGARATNGSNRAVGNVGGTGVPVHQQALSSATQGVMRTNDGNYEDEGIGMDFDEGTVAHGIGSVNGKALHGPPRPPVRRAQDPPAWTFDALEKADGGSSMSSTRNNTPDADDEDAASDRPNAGGSEDMPELVTDRIQQDFADDGEEHRDDLFGSGDGVEDHAWQDADGADEAFVDVSEN